MISVVSFWKGCNCLNHKNRVYDIAAFLRKNLELGKLIGSGRKLIFQNEQTG